MLKTDKERIVSELAAELSAAETLIVADYRGLTNKQLESLRDVLLEHGARFRIVKNTLTRRAAEQAGADALLVMLEGPTAIAFIESNGDPAAVAKALQATARETNVLELRGGILEGKTLSRLRGRTARDAAAPGRAPRPARRGDHRSAHAAARARLRSAHRSRRAHRRPDQAARGAGRGRRGGSGRRSTGSRDRDERLPRPSPQRRSPKPRRPTRPRPWRRAPKASPSRRGARSGGRARGGGGHRFSRRGELGGRRHELRRHKLRRHK